MSAEALRLATPLTATQLPAPLRFDTRRRRAGVSDRQRHRLRARAVRRHPRRRKGEIGAGCASQFDSDRRRRICRVCDLGRRHRTTRSGLHGARRPEHDFARAVATGSCANGLRGSRRRRRVAVRQPRVVARTDRSPHGKRLDVVHRPRTGIFAAPQNRQRNYRTVRSERRTRKTLLRLQRSCRARASSSKSCRIRCAQPASTSIRSITKTRTVSSR